MIKAKQTGKKVLSVLLSVIFIVSAFCGCSGGSKSEATEKETTTETTNETTTETIPENTLGITEIGDRIKLDGDYHRWQVVAVKDNCALLITSLSFSSKQYNDLGIQHDPNDMTNYIGTTWENCTLRSYLNGEWYDLTFTEEVKSHILTTNVINSPNPKYNTDAGNDTMDKVFLLSIDEVNTYFSGDRERETTNYNPERTNEWWLRTPGYTSSSVATVDEDGAVNYEGKNVNKSRSIRPALWIELY